MLKRLKKPEHEHRYRIITSLERAGYDVAMSSKLAANPALLAEICKRRWNLPDSIVMLDPLSVDWRTVADYADPSSKLKNKFRGKKRRNPRHKRKGFYSSPEWLRVRYEALKKHGRRCAVCGATPANNVQMHVDHIKPRSLYPNLQLSLDNLQILCAPCNLGKGNSDQIDWRGK